MIAGADAGGKSKEGSKKNTKNIGELITRLKEFSP